MLHSLSAAAQRYATIPKPILHGAELCPLTETAKPTPKQAFHHPHHHQLRSCSGRMLTAAIEATTEQMRNCLKFVWSGLSAFWAKPHKVARVQEAKRQTHMFIAVLLFFVVFTTLLLSLKFLFETQLRAARLATCLITLCGYLLDLWMLQRKPWTSQASEEAGISRRRLTFCMVHFLGVFNASILISCALEGGSIRSDTFPWLAAVPSTPPNPSCFHIH